MRFRIKDVRRTLLQYIANGAILTPRKEFCMTEDQKYQKYCTDVLKLPLDQCEPSKKMITESLGYQRYNLGLQIDIFKTSVKNGIPKWLRRFV